MIHLFTITFAFEQQSARLTPPEPGQGKGPREPTSPSTPKVPKWRGHPADPVVSDGPISTLVFGVRVSAFPATYCLDEGGETGWMQSTDPRALRIETPI